MSLQHKPAISSLGSTIEISEIESLAKGTIIVGDSIGAPSSVVIGADNTILQADSAQASGVAWRSEVGIGIAPVAGSRLTLPQENDAVTPTVSFGDGDTGFYESADDILVFTSTGIARFQFNGAFLRSVNSSGPGFVNEAASAINPTILPDTSDIDTGIGHSGADQLSLIAGGVEQMRIISTGAQMPNGKVIQAAGGGLAGTLDLRNGGVDSAVALSGDTVNFTQGWLYADGNVANIGFGLASDANQNSADIFITANQIELRAETTAGVSATRIEVLEDKIGFFTATPVVKPASTSDIKDSLVSLGLITDGGATPLNLDAGTLTAGVGTFTGDVFSTAWTDFGGTSTIVGWVTPLANSTLINYKKVGNIVYVQFYLDGVSDATTVTFTLPFTQISTNGVELKVAIQVGDNAVIQAAPGMLTLPSNSVIATCHLDMSGAAWTASGNKRVQGQFWYEAQ